ncbi:hypothetical protein SADUNF_Sadunf16G0067900 [Salix dunnii]|uniref:CASP-like protein n=1 Tax=Salix dunnii TaxID=1413687 RepID=A0A835JAS5_9ROSI|nr:hypothetical protein SADUNF_Sadunf16G0067900 [Salix dunnii]
MMSESTAVDMPESSSVSKGKAPLIAAPMNKKGGYKKGIAIFDFILRLAAIVTALAAAASMGTSDETLPFFTQFFQFQASYDDLPTFQFFVIAMAIVAGYLVLSLPFSIVAIVRPHAAGPRLLLLILDTYGDFCQKVSGSVVASFLTVVILVFLVVLVDIPADTSAAAKGTAPLIAVSSRGKGGYKKGLAIFDFVLRLGAVAATLAAAAIMGTTDQTLPFFTQFFQFEASYDDLPTFFVIAMAIVSGYLVLSLPFSIVAIIRPHATGPRLLLIILDTVALTLNMAAAGAATAIVYLAHNGNSSANWLAICNQFGDFCQNSSGAVVASFIAAVVLLILVVISALALRKH